MATVGESTIREGTMAAVAGNYDPAAMTREELIGEVARLNEELSRFRDVERFKSAFSRAVYHDLKSPINTILSCVNVVFEGTVGAVSKEQKNFLKKAENGLYKLSSLVERLLKIREIEGSIFDRKPDDLLIEEVLRPLVETATVKASEKGVRLEIEIEEGLPSIWADKNSFYHILQNLVSNAVKYTPGGGEVRVKAAREGDRLAISVKDNGIGIDESEIPNLFRPFYRCKGAAEMDSKGTGLGLSIVKMICDACGGGIEVESRPGVGSVFKFTYPFDAGGRGAVG